MAARSGAIPSLALLATLALTGCGPEQKQYETTLTSADGASVVAISVWDRADIVRSIEPAPADPHAGMVPTVTLDPAGGDSLIVSWLGAVCEIKTEFGFRKDGDRYRLSAVHETRSSRDTGCSAAGLQRAIRIRFASPVTPEQVLVEGAPLPVARL